MVLQKRLEYGFNGYQVPPTPRAARSARKRVSSWKKPEDNNRMCAFDLLATVAGKLLLEGNNNSVDKLSQEETLVVEDSNIKTEENRLNVNICDQGSCNKSFFVSEIISKAPFTDTFSCKIGDRNDKETKIEDTKDKNGKPPVVDNLDSNVNLIIRDDDENSSGCTQPPTLNNNTFRPPPRIGDRRIRRLLASKQWKFAPKLNDDAHVNMDLKTVYHEKKTFYKHQRSLRDYPFKKRRLYELDNLSNFDDKSNSKGSVEDHSGLGATAQDPTFQARDSHVKLKIKSFRVPEFFIETPETATVGSLKRTVMEAVTAIFSGELRVGVMLQGKKIGDDNKTLLQMGICHDNELDALGFTLEPKKLRVSPSLCSEDRFVVLPPGMPKPLTRYSPPQAVANFSNVTESDHDSAPSHSDSRALVPVQAVDTDALAVVPMRKTKQADVSQRRIRRPFSVSEVEALVQAVEKLGTGRWRDVKLRAFDSAKHRTYVDLKDKWKTLVHTAKISPQQRRGEPVPQELLDRVLAAHGYWSHHQAKHQLKHQPQPETCRLI